MRARDNPFRSERLETVRYRLADGSWDDLLSRLERLHYRAAIVGPRGSGKTTLLGDLAPRLRARGFRCPELFLNEETPCFEQGFLYRLWTEIGPRDVLLFDGAEQLGPLGWPRFRLASRRAGGLVVTSHRAGLLPTLVRCATSPELLEGVLTELVGELTPELQRTARSLYDDHRGNLRDALSALYDRYAEMADGPEPIHRPGGAP